MKRHIGTILLCCWVPVLAAQTPTPVDQQDQQGPKPEQSAPSDKVQGEAERTVTAVKPGAPVIKKKDLYEGPGYIHPFGRMPRYVLHDQAKIWTSPFRMSKQNAKYWAIFGGATAALIATDKWTAKDLPNTNGQLTVGTWGSKLGAAYSLIPMTGAFYFIGSAAHNDRFRETALLSFEALIDTTIVETVLKAATQRERPLEGSGNGSFWSGQGSVWNASFPSGHAINTWALASVWAHQYRHTKVVPILAYTVGATVVGARLAARRHFPGDVVAGAAMGWFIGDYVYATRHNDELDPKKTSALHNVLSHVRVNFSLN
jgi:membrane-associated phospholipid phosphatase